MLMFSKTENFCVKFFERFSKKYFFISENGCIFAPIWQRIKPIHYYIYENLYIR